MTEKYFLEIITKWFWFNADKPTLNMVIDKVIGASNRPELFEKLEERFITKIPRKAAKKFITFLAIYKHLKKVVPKQFA